MKHLYVPLFEPIAPSPEHPRECLLNSYIRPCSGGGPCWAIYCYERYPWLLRQLVQQRVSIEHFIYPSKRVPKSKCLQIALALKRILAEEKLKYPEITEADIQFWGHCGGAKIHWNYDDD